MSLTSAVCGRFFVILHPQTKTNNENITAKVLLINSSARPKGCTARALKEVEKTLQEQGIETVWVNVGNKAVRGCVSCFKCQQLGKCVFDDLVNETAPLFAEADGIVVGTPVYYAHSNGGVLAFFDRLFFSCHCEKLMKVGAAVVSSRRAGSTSAFDEINKYFTMTGMPIVSSTYWNEVHGYSQEDVEKDLEGLQTMRNLGRNMAFLIKSIALGKEQMGLPEKEFGAFTNFMDGLSGETERSVEGAARAHFNGAGLGRKD